MLTLNFLRSLLFVFIFALPTLAIILTSRVFIQSSNYGHQVPSPLQFILQYL